jgi:hypothetical protein
MRAFLNRVLRNMFDHKRAEVTKDGRNLHDKELKDLYSS